MIHTRKTALEQSVKNILLQGLNQFHGANLALNYDVDQDTFGKVTKHIKTQHTPSRWPHGCKEQTRQHNTHLH